MMPIAPSNEMIPISSNHLLCCIEENQIKIEKRTVDTTKVSPNNYDEFKDGLLSTDKNVHDKAFENRDEDGMRRKILMISGDIEQSERDSNQIHKEKRLKSSFESPTPYESKYCYEYELCSESVELFIPIPKDHTPFSTYDSKFDEEWNTNVSFERPELFHRPSLQSSSYNQSHHSLPQSLLMPIL